MLYLNNHANIISIKTFALFLENYSFKNSPDLRSALGLIDLPHPSQISRFRINFLDQIHLTLNNLVAIVNSELIKVVTDVSKILIAETTGFEGYVTENNTKFFDYKLQLAKNILKSGHGHKIFNIYKHAQGNA